MPTLTFGKWKDYNIEDPRIPNSYLEWLGENTKDLRTQQMCTDELRRRAGGKTNTKLSRGEFAEQLVMLLEKCPEGLKNQTVQTSKYEITIKVKE